MTAAFFVADGGAMASASAPDSEWDRLAQCESGGNWSINSGNGYYGGLQFNLGTWRSVGGTGRPDQASRSEQIARANRLHDSRGFSPWPSCSRKLGLRSGAAGPSSAAGEAEASTERVTERASRSKRAAAKAAPVKAAPKVVVPKAVPVVGKYQASRRARVVVALATTAPPVFDGHTLTVGDAKDYRIAVKHWQRRMAARGWNITVDGHFGPESASVAQRFAAQKGLTGAAAGTVDKNVWDAAWKLAVS